MGKSVEGNHTTENPKRENNGRATKFERTEQWVYNLAATLMRKTKIGHAVAKQNNKQRQLLDPECTQKVNHPTQPSAPTPACYSKQKKVMLPNVTPC